MEDLTTARISVAQTTQRIIHSAKDADSGDVHNLALANAFSCQRKKLLNYSARVLLPTEVLAMRLYADIVALPRSACSGSRTILSVTFGA